MYTDRSVVHETKNISYIIFKETLKWTDNQGFFPVQALKTVEMELGRGSDCPVFESDSFDYLSGHSLGQIKCQRQFPNVYTDGKHRISMKNKIDPCSQLCWQKSNSVINNKALVCQLFRIIMIDMLK